MRESATVQYQLSLVVTASHYITYCTQSWGLCVCVCVCQGGREREGGRVGGGEKEERKEGGRKGEKERERERERESNKHTSCIPLPPHTTAHTATPHTHPLPTLTTQLISEDPSSCTSLVSMSESRTACILSVQVSVR